MSDTKNNGQSTGTGRFEDQSSSNGDGSKVESPNAGISPSQEIAEWEKKAKEAENRYLYLYADFENFKKRAFKERSDTLKFGWEPIARELLQSVDNLERALGFMQQAEIDSEKNTGSKQSLSSGLTLCLTEFLNTLKKFGVEKVETKGRAFDPNFHESIGQAPSELPAGAIVNEEQKGYTLHGRLLRPSRVILSSGISPQN